jgi:uncharacterized protein (TIGR02001 family)
MRLLPAMAMVVMAGALSAGRTCAQTPATEQAGAEDTLQVSIGVASQERRRGLGWSGGRPAANASIRVPIVTGLSVSARATSLGRARRYERADGVIDLTAGIARQYGAVRVNGEVIRHQFIGAAGPSFWELGGDASTTFGPARFDLFMRYAPHQDAIGGQNLYMGAGLQAGIPGTPLSLSAHVGRSTGSHGDSLARYRLRPDVRYHDYSIGLDYVARNWLVGLRYSDTDIRRTPENRAFTGHSGSAIVASLTLFP